MTITKAKSIFFLLVALAGCTFELTPTPPQEDAVPEETEDAPPGDAVDAQTPISWEAVADAPLARIEGQSAVVGGELYVFGGYTDDSIIPKSLEMHVYNPAADLWERMPDTPRPLTHAGTAVHGKDIYVAGGVVGSKDPEKPEKLPATTEVWRFSTEYFEWVEMPPLPEPRGAGALVVLNDALHFFGGTGMDRSQEVADHWVLALDEPDEWVSVAPLPNPRNHLAGVVVDGIIYAVGGQHGHNETLRTQSSVQAYDAEFDGWYDVAPLPTGLGHISHSTFVVDGKIVIVGGETTGFGIYTDAVLIYDPATDTWTNATSFPTSENSMMGGVIGKDIFISGGSDLSTRTLKGTLNP